MGNQSVHCLIPQVSENNPKRGYNNMEAKTLQAELRNDFGKNTNNRLRSSGFIPAVVYSHGESQPIKVTEKALFNLFKGRVSANIIFDLQISGSDDVTAFVKNYQMDPVTGKIIHLDFFKVTKGEKIQTKVPLDFVGSPIGLKSGGFVEIYHHEIEVECLPKDLPEKISIDISSLDLDNNIHAKNITLADSVKLISNSDVVLVAVHSPRTSGSEASSETETAKE